ncbi:hypothetical protein E5C26_13280 [Serratia proteamaculans]|nr:hypothetical protein E5C26_13280 [Serratia proteamaculans]
MLIHHCETRIFSERQPIHWSTAVNRAGIRRRNPYHTRHTFACWLLSAAATPSQMGIKTHNVYQVYRTWIDKLNSDQADKLAF